jgi:hypothetical protein
MSIHKRRDVLAMDAKSFRFAFVVLDAAEVLIDWGLRSFRRGVKAVSVPPEDKIAGRF